MCFHFDDVLIMLVNFSFQIFINGVPDDTNVPLPLAAKPPLNEGKHCPAQVCYV